MLSPYKAIFAAPGTKGFAAAGLLARMPMGMFGIGLVTMLSELRGSYGLAGSVTAVSLAAMAVISPRVSRAVDRYGQTRTMVPATAITVLGSVALVLCARFEMPSWTLFLCSATTGFTPNIGAMVRARWAQLYGDQPARLHTAYSFESVVDEVCFIVGPLVSVGLSTNWFPEAGPLASAVLLAVGAVLLSVQRATEPPAYPKHHHHTGSVLRSLGLRSLVISFSASGLIFGAVDVATVAFADEMGNKSASSLVLACCAAGSCLSGIAFGLVGPAGPPAKRLVVGQSVMAVCMVPLLFVGSLPVLAGMLFIAGLSIAPTLVSSTALVERLVPRRQLTEGLTWTTTGLVIGVAAGSPIAGWITDRADASAAYGVAVCGGALALTASLLGWRWLSAAPPAREPAIVASGESADAADRESGDGRNVAPLG